MIYGVLRYFEEEHRGARTQVRKYKTLFRTVDAVTYSDITTVQLKVGLFCHLNRSLLPYE